MNAAKHTRHDNGGAAFNWKVLSIRPLFRGAMAFAAIPFPNVRSVPNGDLLVYFSKRLF